MAATLDDLTNTITRSSKEVLAPMAIGLCQKNPCASEFMKDWLFVNEAEVPQTGIIKPDKEASEDGNGSNDKRAPPPPFKNDITSLLNDSGPKRDRTRYEVCLNCEREYDVSQNTRTSCSYHPDYPNPDEDFFADDDGEPYTEENLINYPEGFIYECCKRRGDEDPCAIDWHTEKEYRAPKRQKLEWM